MQKHNITSEAYFALPHASNSRIKDAFEMFIAGKEKYDPTKAYRDGSAFDALTTAMEELNSDQVDMQNILKMKASLSNNEIYTALFKGHSTQLVITEEDFKFQHDGLDLSVPAKCKFDLFNGPMNFGGDLKSTMATTQQQFEAASKHFQYHRQAAWYMDISGTNRFVIIGVSKKAPYKTFVISILKDSPAYIAGKELYSKYATAWWKLSPM